MRSHYVCYNPAKELEKIGDELKLYRKRSDLNEKMADLEKVEALEIKFNQEFDRVYLEYCTLLQTYTISVNEISNLFDLSIQYVTRHMVADLDGIYFSKYFRRFLKENASTNNRLVELAKANHIDINKRIFFSQKSLEEWCFRYMRTYNRKPLSRALIRHLTSDKYSKVLLGTNSFKNKYELFYDVQVYRKGRERVYIYNNIQKLSARRFFNDEKLDDVLRQERECHLN